VGQQGVDDKAGPDHPHHAEGKGRAPEPQVLAREPTGHLHVARIGGQAVL
jgi:hypothetical protein